MKIRKSKDLSKVLKQKGFILDPKKGHHHFYYLTIDGIKYPVYTYLSHSISEYGNSLMSDVKKQLGFKKTIDAENFFDCPMTKDQYIEFLVKEKVIEIDTEDEINTK